MLWRSDASHANGSHRNAKGCDFHVAALFSSSSRRQRPFVVCAKTSWRLQITAWKADSFTPAKAGVQETPEASWIPAPDQVEGRLCAGMTRSVAIEGGQRTRGAMPGNLRRHRLSRKRNSSWNKMCVSVRLLVIRVVVVVWWVIVEPPRRHGGRCVEKVVEPPTGRKRESAWP